MKRRLSRSSGWRRLARIRLADSFVEKPISGVVCEDVNSDMMVKDLSRLPGLICENGITFAFRFLSRLFFRAIALHRFHQSNLILISIRSIFAKSPSDLQTEFLVKWGTRIWADRAPESDSQHLQWVQTLHHPIAEKLVALMPSGGRFRRSSRAMIARRLFTKDKESLHDTYLPYLVDNINSETVRVLGSDCRIFVSSGQFQRLIVAAPDDVITAVLLAWRSIQKPEVKMSCQVRADDLQRILLIRDPDRRRRRFDLVTSAAPRVVLFADELHRFHLSGLPDHQNPNPWLHATVVLKPTDYLQQYAVQFYLAKQRALRTEALDQTKNLLAPFVPVKDLAQIVAHFLISQLTIVNS